jgi:molybdenum cofactor cytidylyltransferase
MNTEPNMHKSIDIIILAAGNSRRFDGDKRLLMLQTILHTITQTFSNNNIRIICVLKSSDKNQLPNLLGEYQHHQALNVVWNDKPEQGMGHSLALAAKQLTADACMVFLADMPLIKAHTLQQLLPLLTAHNIVTPSYQQQRGHPVCFGRDFYEELQQLQGDKGAKHLFDKYPEACITIETDDKGVLIDIDTPNDWQQYQDL